MNRRSRGPARTANPNTFSGNSQAGQKSAPASGLSYTPVTSNPVEVAKAISSAELFNSTCKDFINHRTQPDFIAMWATQASIYLANHSTVDRKTLINSAFVVMPTLQPSQVAALSANGSIASVQPLTLGSMPSKHTGNGGGKIRDQYNALYDICQYFRPGYVLDIMFHPDNNTILFFGPDGPTRIDKVSLNLWMQFVYGCVTGFMPDVDPAMPPSCWLQAYKLIDRYRVKAVFHDKNQRWPISFASETFKDTYCFVYNGYIHLAQGLADNIFKDIRSGFNLVDVPQAIRLAGGGQVKYYSGTDPQGNYSSQTTYTEGSATVVWNRFKALADHLAVLKSFNPSADSFLGGIAVHGVAAQRKVSISVSSDKLMFRFIVKDCK